jgi:DNA-binding MarR family transcriptional regulator
MKYVHDSQGLYDPSVREALERFTGGTDTAQFEAAAAVRAAAHAVERLQGLGERSRALSSGAVDLLLRLDAVGDDDLGTGSGAGSGTDRGTGGAGVGGAGVGELARAAGFSSRNVTGLVDTLERAGLVRRAPDPEDRRAVVVSITAAGKRWVAEFREPARLAMGALFHGFTDAEVNQLRDFCLRLVVNQEAVARRVGGESTSDRGSSPG